MGFSFQPRLDPELIRPLKSHQAILDGTKAGKRPKKHEIEAFSYYGETDDERFDDGYFNPDKIYFDVNIGMMDDLVLMLREAGALLGQEDLLARKNKTIGIEIVEKSVWGIDSYTRKNIELALEFFGPPL